MENKHGMTVFLVLAVIATVMALIYHLREYTEKPANTDVLSSVVRDAVVLDDSLPPPIFHIKVVAIQSTYDFKTFYFIAFTNDDFCSEHWLMEVNDFSDVWSGGGVLKSRLSLKSKSEAIRKVDTLDSFETCLAYNRAIDKEEERLIAYRKAHPVKREPPREVAPPEEFIIK